MSDFDAGCEGCGTVIKTKGPCPVCAGLRRMAESTDGELEAWLQGYETMIAEWDDDDPDGSNQ